MDCDGVLAGDIRFIRKVITLLRDVSYIYTLLYVCTWGTFTIVDCYSSTTGEVQLIISNSVGYIDLGVHQCILVDIEMT